MREVTLFLHSQKIQRPEPFLAAAMARLATGMRSVLTGLARGVRAASASHGK
jgi:hypothetical protein